MRALLRGPCICRIVPVLGAGIALLFADMPPSGAQTSLSALPSPAAVPHSRASSQDEFSGKVLIDHDMVGRMMNQRLFNAPRVGEKAPAFSLLTAEGSKRVSLSQLHEDRPVVLILSSWGCDIFRESLGGLQALYSNYGDRAEFAMIYIREAHPFNGAGAALGRINDLNTMQDRLATARRCQQQLRLPFIVLCDSIDDPVATRWAAWPVRTFVVESDGTVSYAGKQGPWGYHPYRGFLHGDGKALRSDQYYSEETLEQFLGKRFAARSELTEGS